MSLLAGKKALVFGVANKYSIAWAIAEMFKQEGADVGLSYAIPQLEKRVQPLAEELGVTFVEKCDVTSDDEIDAVFEKAGAHFSEIDILVHAIAFAPSNELEGRFYNTSREGFRVAMDISAYSYVALAQRALNLMPNGGSMVTMTYYGAEKVVPHYNVMGVAKAALEASTRYLAADLGPHNIRVNAISAGPIKTLAAAGIAGFRKMLGYVGERAPLRRNIDQEEVAKTALWLCSDLGSGVTGEIVYVDAGYHILGMPEPPEKWE
ncbi:MAG: enoyl-ACP reductase [Anaerolineae bacterium]|nr:enoyl-ACP reductase [Anaerolineae bacterium]RIK24249.1 MAG: NADH-specific enoyl-ACP reductase [Anaerolineae bacterium]